MCRKVVGPICPITALVSSMADIRKLHSVRNTQNNAKDNVSLGEESGTSALFMKLFAAVCYGLSSFFIVVVNKSVLSNYR